MKKLMTTLMLIVSMTMISQAQTLNWRSLSEAQNNLAYAEIGYNNGAITQIGYGRILHALKPILLTMDYSFPMGSTLMDDFKARIGGQIEVLEIGGFSLSASIMGNFRRYESALVRISSFGAELSAVAGYYTPGWYLAGELGFDKSIISNLKHSDIMKDSFNEINDGWYIPSGGHYIYGIQAGKRLGRSMEITLRAGLTNAQGGHLDALLPYYAQIGIIKVF